MSMSRTLPPRAYTRETLSTAFQWLQDQPESVKRLAQNPDTLVALYSRAQRNGGIPPAELLAYQSQLQLQAESLLHRSGFSDELKALSESTSKNSSQQVAATDAVTEPAPAVATAAATPHKPTTAKTLAAAAVATATTTANSVSTHITPQASLMDLNQASLKMLAEVRTAMNLSSDAETINMMVAVAYKTLKNLVP